MNRRALIALPGIAALAVGRAVSQTEDVAAAGIAPHISRKALSQHTGSKASYKVPKNAAKQTKYLNSLTTLLSLTAGQQMQAGAIFTNAASAQSAAHTSLKAARKALSQAVMNCDNGAIAQASAALGTLTAQYAQSGALANAAVFQLLTPAQQAKLSQFQG